MSQTKFSRIIILWTLSSSLLLSACGGMQTSAVAPAPEAYPRASLHVDAPAETLDEPYLPLDDGIPMTAAELAAFNSRGVLDANLSAEDKRLVELHFKDFIHKNRKNTERYIQRSAAYLPYILKILRTRGMPEEIACLAFVESGFNPNAVSRVGAGGMWQFMPSTGRKYGLTQDRWIDERRDPFESTEAAAEYLTMLHEMFGDWLLALAAYNAGEGKIGRALEGTGAEGFFELIRKNDRLSGRTRLKLETLQYVPRFLAFTKIMRNLEALGFESPDASGALDTAVVDMPPGVDLQAFARAMGLNWQDFQTLNPAFRRQLSPTDRSSRAYLPVAKAAQARAWLSGDGAGLYAGWKDYRVRSGDTMGAISRRNGISVAMLQHANGRNNTRLRAGEYILIPTTSSTRSAQAPQAAQTARTARSAAAAVSGTITVQSGDTLYSLARTHGVSMAELRALNKLGSSSLLRVGQRLRLTPQAVNVAAANSGTASDAGGGRIIRVRSGDTLYELARTHKTTVAALAGANGINPRGTLKIGQRLRLP